MMKNLTSKQKILFGVYAMILAMFGDYLLGFGTFSFSEPLAFRIPRMLIWA